MMVSDVHVPYHDKRAWETAVAASEDLKPDVIVIGGDFLDCYVCSKFDKAPTRFSLLSDELREARTELAKLNASRVIYVEGNHEHRLTSYVIRNTAPLAGLVSIESALRIRERGWQWVPYPQHVTIGDLRIQHEPMLGGKYGAIRTLESGGAISWAFGHTHTGQVASMGTPDGSEIHAVNTGWLGDFDSLAFDYCSPAMARQRWRHGFGLFYQDRGKTISAQFVQIINGACVVNGRRVAA
jgi:predicted phosphodiesterase